MNLPCLLAMLFNCSQFPEIEDKVLLPKSEVSRPAQELIADLGNDDVEAREKKILEFFRQGLWPEKLGHFKPVQVRENGHQLTYWVSADYLSFGTNDDSVLIPLSWTVAKQVLAGMKMLVPSAKMVDQIYQQATRVHWPHAYPPSDEMRSTPYLLEHNQWIQERTSLEIVENPLIAGHKKDLVVSPRLLVKTGKLAIYGWHNLGNGAAIQPLSLWHGKFYVDYSHGIRLVAPEAELDGKKVSLARLLKDPLLAPLLSFEGAFDICEVVEYPCDN